MVASDRSCICLLTVRKKNTQVTEGASADSDTTSDYSRWVWFDLICEILSWKVCTEGIRDVVELSQMQTLNRIDIFSRISQILIKRA